MKNLFTSSFLSKLNAAQCVNGLYIGFRLARTGVFVQALDREKKYLVIDIHSVDFETNPIKEDRIRANMYCGQTLMRPVGKGETEIELILFVDPRGHIPTWLVNMAQKSMPYNFLRALEEKASRTNYELRPSFKKMLDQLIILLTY